ncbi:MAG: sulfite exporter TauE/SafE family protein [Gemmatimonadaceae bacterium]
MSSLLFLAIGVGAGVFAGLFGIGGGVVIVPALMLLGRMSPQLATGTSLGALVLPVGALGAWTYYRAGHLDVRAALWIALGLFAGILAGALVAQGMSGPTLRRLFAAFLVMLAVKRWTMA